jgi:hypothetical protein
LHIQPEDVPIKSINIRSDISVFISLYHKVPVPIFLLLFFHFLPNVQRCLVHFLRAISDELEITPEDQSLCRLKDGIKSIIEKGNQLKALGDAQQQHAGRKQLQHTLETLAKLKSENKKTNTLIKRLVRHQQGEPCPQVFSVIKKALRHGGRA